MFVSPFISILFSMLCSVDDFSTLWFDYYRSEINWLLTHSGAIHYSGFLLAY